MPKKLITGIVSIVVLVALVAGVVAMGLGSATPGKASDSDVSGNYTYVPSQRVLAYKSGPPNFLHTEGTKIVDSHGMEFHITGVNWFGGETGTFAPHGLWARNWQDMLDQIASLGYNTIRLPYSDEMFDARSLPDGIDYKYNPDLHGLTSLQIMDKIIEGAGQRGLRVILDRHRPDQVQQSKLWYTKDYSEQRWIDDWKMLAARYRGNDTIIGADIDNEPHAMATWGSNDPKTDWRLAAEKAGNAILSVNSNWLIFVEGIEVYNNDWFWWGGNLKGVTQYPVQLNVPNRLVYSPHEYGPGVWATQGWFKDPAFPKNLPKIWDDHWGFIINNGIAPVMVGEFGGRRVDTSSPEGQWQRAFLSYLKSKDIGFTYWAFNANSGDTGGILDENDPNWKAVDKNKQALLSKYLAPQSPPGQATRIDTSAVADYSTPTTRRAEMNGDLRVLYNPGTSVSAGTRSAPDIRIENVGVKPISLAGLELRYWISADSANLGQEKASLTWASAGDDNVSVKLSAMPGLPQVAALDVRFSKDAGQILGDGGVAEVQAKISAPGTSTVDQSKDYSFDKDRDPQSLDYSDFRIWEKIGLYKNGQLIWGAEPKAGT